MEEYSSTKIEGRRERLERECGLECFQLTMNDPVKNFNELGSLVYLLCFIFFRVAGQ